MSLIYRRPWTRQPQTAPTLAQRYASANLVVLPSIGALNLSKTKPTTVTSSGTVSRGTNRYGQTFGFSSSYLDVGAVQGGLAEEFTLVVIVEMTAAGSYPMILSANNGGTDIFELRGFANSGSIELSCKQVGGAYIEARDSTNIVGLGPQVIVATFKTDTAKLWRNGPLVASASNAGGAFSWGTHSWRVGDRAVSGGFPLTGSVGLVACLPFAVPDAEAASLAVNPWQLFAPLPRRIWAPAAGGGGDASIALTGAATASSLGAMTAAGGASAALTGAAAASAAGTVSASASTDATASLVGASLAAAAGTASATGGASAAVTGAQASSTAGTAAASAGVSASTTLSGATAATAAGTAAATGGASIALTGAGAASAAGTTTAAAGGSATATLVGSSAAASAGTIAATGAAIAAVTGAASASAAGTVIASIGTNATVALTGAAVAASAGALVVNGAAQIVLIGASGAASAGTVSAAGQTDATATISGAAAIAACGTVAAASGALSPNSAPPSGHGPALSRRGAVVSTGRRSNVSTRTR